MSIIKQIQEMKEMEKTRISLFLAFVLLAINLTGCTSIRGSDAAGNYRELKDGSYESAAGIKEDAIQIELTDASTLSDYLAYAALHNPGLKAAFNRWKAALEKIPQVNSLPDPRFTYAYFIENVETRVGPQRHKLDISQTFPWFGKLQAMKNALETVPAPK